MRTLSDDPGHRRPAFFFEAEDPSGLELQPNWNTAPTQDVPIVLERAEDGAPARQLVSARWGLVPSWAKDVKIGSRMINARSETILEKPSFRSAAVKRRALVPADGYYEWQKTEDGKIPTYRPVRVLAGPGPAGRPPGEVAALVHYPDGDRAGFPGPHHRWWFRPACSATGWTRSYRQGRRTGVGRPPF